MTPVTDLPSAVVSNCPCRGFSAAMPLDPAGATRAATKAASAAGEGWSKMAVTGRLMENRAATAFRSSTAPRESSPACTAIS